MCYIFNTEQHLGNIFVLMAWQSVNVMEKCVKQRVSFWKCTLGKTSMCQIYRKKVSNRIDPGKLQLHMNQLNTSSKHWWTKKLIPHGGMIYHHLSLISSPACPHLFFEQELKKRREVGVCLFMYLFSLASTPVPAAKQLLGGLRLPLGFTDLPDE